MIVPKPSQPILVPKLRLGNPLDAKLRLATRVNSAMSTSAIVEAELRGECVPKLEFGNEVVEDLP
jgi:hypothetical protein